MDRPITLDATVCAIPDQLSCVLSGETVILNLKDGTYFGLEAVGARIWELVQRPRTAQELCDALVQEYDTDPRQCRSDLLALLAELEAHSLIMVTRTAAPGRVG